MNSSNGWIGTDPPTIHLPAWAVGGKWLGGASGQEPPWDRPQGRVEHRWVAGKTPPSFSSPAEQWDGEREGGIERIDGMNVLNSLGSPEKFLSTSG